MLRTWGLGRENGSSRGDMGRAIIHSRYLGKEKPFIVEVLQSRILPCWENVPAEGTDNP